MEFGDLTRCCGDDGADSDRSRALDIG